MRRPVRGGLATRPGYETAQEFDLRVVCLDASKGKSDRLGDYSTIVFLGIGRDKLPYVDAVLDHIVLDQLVRKTIVFCEQ